jgi:hypothetical protein
VGRGIDAAGDHRLLYCKGAGRLVALDEARARDLPIGEAVLCGVPPDVEVEAYRGHPERSRPPRARLAQKLPKVVPANLLRPRFTVASTGAPSPEFTLTGA